MSQSPDGSADSTQSNVLNDYRNAWSALSQLIGQGRSFSGRERNCCFLNLGDGRFADVSSALDVDLIDDGRAVALCDWDHDGAQDLWIANRTAPRVRLLRNRIGTTAGHWIALRLQGTTSNRDAIGARVRLHLDDQSTTPLIKTLHAGDGYLSQSSKWIHFGLGNASTVQRLEVDWPGGEREVFERLAIDRRYRLVQGSGTAERWTPPATRSTPSLVAMPAPKAGEPSSNTRTWMLGRLPLPWETFHSSTEKLSTLEAMRGRPVLVNLWSQSCLPCLNELQEWAGEHELLKACQIVPLCVDVMEGSSDEFDQAAQLLGRLSPSFVAGAPTAELLEGMEALQRTVLEKQQPLPVPSSFLLDKFGRVAGFYKGRVSGEQLLHDLQLLEADRKQQRDEAVPFAGRWASNLFPFDPLPLVKTLELAGRNDAAIQYLRRYARLLDEDLPTDVVVQEKQESTRIAVYQQIVTRSLQQGVPVDSVTPYLTRLCKVAPTATGLHRQLAIMLLSQHHARLSLPHFELAFQHDSRDATLRYNFGLALISTRNVDRAIEMFRSALELEPADAATHFHLANALQMRQPPQFQQAAKHYRQALEAEPNSILAANNLAWLLATSHDDSLRDGTEAVRWAEQCCKLTHSQDATLLSTLACAYAEAGEFDRAQHTNRLAIERAKKAERPAKKLIDDLNRRQNLFESGQPFRQNAD